MLDNFASLMILRNRLLTVKFADTGPTTLVATGNGFTRPAGDFVADGLVKGMEITPTGFTNNDVGVIKTIEPTAITLINARLAQVSGAGRSLSVVIPELREWENIKMDPNEERWSVKEEFVFGNNQQDSLGPLGTMSHYPIYIVTVYGLPGIGAKALYKMVDTILDVFPPRLVLTLADGTVLRIRSEPAPFRGPTLYDDGDPFIIVTIPLWARTTNTI